MAEEDTTKPVPRRFRFKDKSKSPSRPRRRRHSDEDIKDAHRNPPEREHRHKRRRTKRESTIYDRTFQPEGTYMDPDNRWRESLFDGFDRNLDSDTAFRESLFDALADDEGAAYWEGVYGQPIHNYENTKTGPQGELERMTDDEYAEYVRGKMWEKTHAHIIEEREARERARKKEKENEERLRKEGGRLEEEREAFNRRVQESLKRGEERKKTKEMSAAWARYLAQWEHLMKNKNLSQETAATVTGLIPWPVASGKLRDVSKDEIEYFFKRGSGWKDGRTALLKAERVRWHPDKMQQRFGQHIDTDTMKSVTAVFQVIDRLWDENRCQT